MIPLWLALLGAAGFTLILTGSTIAAPLRDAIPPNTGIGQAIRCPACAGYWVGFGTGLCVLAAPFPLAPLLPATWALVKLIGSAILFGWATSLTASFFAARLSSRPS